MLPVSTIHPASFLAHFLAQRPLMTAAGKELPRQIPWQQWDALKGKSVPLPTLIVSVDNGNDAFKGAMLHASQPFLQTKRLLTAYALPKTIRTGEGMTTWQVNGSQHALVSGVVTLGERRTSMLPLLQEGQNFLMFTGGVSVLLAHILEAFVQTKRDPQDVLFVPKEFASVLNAVGGYVLTQATAHPLLARQNTTTQPTVGGER